MYLLSSNAHTQPYNPPHFSTGEKTPHSQQPTATVNTTSHHTPHSNGRSKAIRKRLLADEMIVIALEDGGKFTVQKALLCSLSDYFTGCLRSNMSENEAKEMTVPECTTEDFELLLYYACHQTLTDFHVAINNMPSSTEAEFTAQIPALKQVEVQLIRLWIYADSLFMRKLQDVAMERLLNIFTLSPPMPDAMRLGFEQTAVDSPMRHLLLNEVMAATTTDQGSSFCLLGTSQTQENGGVPGFLVKLLDHLSPDSDNIRPASMWKALRSMYMVSGADDQN